MTWEGNFGSVLAREFEATRNMTINDAIFVKKGEAYLQLHFSYDRWERKKRAITIKNVDQDLEYLAAWMRVQDARHSHVYGVTNKHVASVAASRYGFHTIKLESNPLYKLWVSLGYKVLGGRKNPGETIVCYQSRDDFIKRHLMGGK